MRVAAAAILLLLGMLVGAVALLAGWHGVRFIRLATEHAGAGMLIQLALVLAAVVLPLVALILAGFGFLLIRYALRRLGRTAANALR